MDFNTQSASAFALDGVDSGQCGVATATWYRVWDEGSGLTPPSHLSHFQVVWIPRAVRETGGVGGTKDLLETPLLQMANLASCIDSASTWRGKHRRSGRSASAVILISSHFSVVRFSPSRHKLIYNEACLGKRCWDKCMQLHRVMKWIGKRKTQDNILERHSWWHPYFL